jgi:hypothetical protein
MGGFLGKVEQHTGNVANRSMGWNKQVFGIVRNFSNTVDNFRQLPGAVRSGFNTQQSNNQAGQLAQSGQQPGLSSSPQGYPAGPAKKGKGEIYMPPPDFDTEIFEVEGADEKAFPSWLAIGIVVAVVILLVILLRFARSERLVTNSPQILSHEDVELQEYSYYVPKLKLPYMFY